MRLVTFHPFRQHNFEQAKFLDLCKGMTCQLNTTIALPPVFKYLNSKWEGRVISWSLYLKCKIHYFTFLRYVRNKDMNELVSSFQHSVIKNIGLNYPDAIIGFDGCSRIVFEALKGKTNLVLDFTTILDEYNFIINPKSYTDRISYLKNDLLNNPHYLNKQREIHLSDLILVGSNQVKDSIIYRFPEYANKIVVINYGCNEKIFHPYTNKTTNLSVIKFLFVGTLSFHKGSDLLFKVWSKLLEENKNIELHLCGSYHPEFKDYINFDNVIYHGFVNQKVLANIMNDVDILVHPTYIEGYSISVLQALTCGLAIIASKNTGVNLKNNVNGLIIEPGSEIELFHAMSELINDQDKINYFKKNNATHFINRTWQKYAEQLSNELQYRFYDFRK